MTEHDIRNAAKGIANYTWNGTSFKEIEAIKEHFREQLAHVSEAHSHLPDEDRYYRWGLEYAYKEALRLLERI